MRRRVLSILLASCLPIASAQTPALAQPRSEPQLSPQAAYDWATRPLEITRRSPQNWSEVELAALKIARENARNACAARNPDQLNGEDLLALAHLCAFALQWQAVYQAASNFINGAPSVMPAENSNDFTELSTAFDYKVQASLNLKNPDDAVGAAQTMLRTVPYDLFASEATSSTIESIRFIRTDQALALLAQRQPLLLARIKAQGQAGIDSTNPAGAGAAKPSNSRPPLPLHALYADALALPLMQQFANQSQAAGESYAELESALPKVLSSEDAMYVGEQRRQYLLLGTHLPVLAPMGFLSFPGASAPDSLNTWFAGATVFLLFPDWCNQCIVMGSNSTSKTHELIESYHVRFFPLLAQANPPEKRVESPVKKVPLSTNAGKAAQSRSENLHVDQQLDMRSTADTLLEGTPTIVVPSDTLDKFAATDFPLIIATDHSGIIRVIQRASDGALTPDGDIDRIVQHIIATWPPD